MYGATHFQMPVAPIRVLQDLETQQTIQDWFNQVTSMMRASRAWGDYMDIEWTAKKDNVTRGFTDTVLNNNVRTSKATKSREVDSLINFICTYAPQLDSIKISS